MLLPKTILRPHPAVRWRRMCETLHKASCFSTTNVTCLTKQPGLRPGLWPRLLKKLGVQTPQRDAGVPEDLTQVYVTDMKYFLTVGQWLQCILGPLGVMAGYEALGLNLGSSVLFGLFEMDMQLMGFAALVFVTFQACVVGWALRRYPVRIYSDANGTRFAAVRLHPFIPLKTGKPILFKSGEAEASPTRLSECAVKVQGHTLFMESGGFKTPVFYHNMMCPAEDDED